MATSIHESTDFSLVHGGPLFQIFRRAHLSGDGLELVNRRIVVISMFTWLPLLVFSFFSGNLLGGTVKIPFLMDIEVHVRFLVALPLLILAERIVHERMRLVVQQFQARNLIPENATARFEAAIASAFRLRNSVWAEVLLVVLVYVVGILVFRRHYAVLDTTTWETVPAVLGSRLSPTGIWYEYVSVPVFQFLLLRWYFRIFIWARFLWQVSRIELNLVPTHPDRVGGLGFLSNIAYAFVPLAAAHGAVLTGMLANRIFYLGATLPSFKAELAIMVVFAECLVFAPLFLFTSHLARAKRRGLREYGTLAERYVREFDTKWLRGGAPANEPFLGSGDIQSLADLGTSFQTVQGMHIAPVKRDAIFRLGVVTLMPVAPLMLTMMPLEEMIKTLFGILF